MQTRLCIASFLREASNASSMPRCMRFGVGIDLLVAFWSSSWLLIALVPLLRNDMVRYNLDTLKHTLSSMAIYGIIRAVSAYLVTVGLPLSVSNVVPFVISALETAGMIANRSKSYAFETRSELFFHYAVFKSAMFLALPHVENFIVAQVKST